jgi:thiamine-phosphate pyrophosphorylase
MLVFCPELVETGRGPTRDPQAVLEACLPEVDAVQVRVKAPGRRSGPSPARAVHDWTLRVLGLCHAIGDDAPLVLVNDRVDVALALARAGCAGCHVGQDDLTPRDARDLLGPDALLGLSTHGARALRESLLAR